MLLLQRVRDEAHRFAIEYQRSLRRKAGMTSILEEIPGIGPRKRQALLKELGSLRRVREALPEELERVSGVSARDAESLHGFFRALAALEGAPGRIREESTGNVVPDVAELPGETPDAKDGAGEADFPN